MVQARFRLGSGFAQVWLRGLVQAGFRFVFRLGSGLGQAWFRLGSGLLRVLLRFG